jgi:anti-anti-sigma regulatory factor
MGSAHTLTFPPTIDFSNAAQYLQIMQDGITGEILVLDLSATEVIHSSFIGFLIHAKEEIETAGGRLILKTSPALKKTLKRLNLAGYFAHAMESGNSMPEMHVTVN